MTTLNPSDTSVHTPTLPAKARLPPLQFGRRFDWAAMFSLLWILLGAAMDGFAHFHGLVDQNFFTPYHALLYSGLLAATFVHFGTIAVNLKRGYSFEASTPHGYKWAVRGVALMGIGGLLDLGYHTLFGIESNIESVLSPTHLILVTGVMLIFSGPFRSLWLRSDPSTPVTWRRDLPSIVSLAIMITITSVYFDYLTPFAAAWASNRYSAIPSMTLANWTSWPMDEFAVAISISAFMFTGALLSSLVLF